MNFWLLLQIFFNIVSMSALIFIIFRLNKPAKDDPRLSRGLQLLQSKISILEDLSDHTENQVKQITHLLEQKIKEIQLQVMKADQSIQKIEISLGKSLEVAQIFQDRIPHQEIIDRQNTMKYVKAAKLAHQGLSVQEISQQVTLNPSELEFIVKVNKEELQFSEESLPAWAKEDSNLNKTTSDFSFQQSEDPVKPQLLEKENISLSQLGMQFRKSIQVEKDLHSSFDPIIEIPEEEIPLSLSTLKPQSQDAHQIPRDDTQNTHQIPREVTSEVFGMNSSQLDSTQTYSQKPEMDHAREPSLILNSFENEIENKNPKKYKEGLTVQGYSINGESIEVKKVQFPKIELFNKNEINRNLG